VAKSGKTLQFALKYYPSEIKMFKCCVFLDNEDQTSQPLLTERRKKEKKKKRKGRIDTDVVRC